MEKDLDDALTGVGNMLNIWINNTPQANTYDYGTGGILVNYSTAIYNKKLETLFIGSTTTPLLFFTGDIAEIILYTKKLTGEETGWVNDYLNDKYNLW